MKIPGTKAWGKLCVLALFAITSCITDPDDVIPDPPDIPGVNYPDPKIVSMLFTVTENPQLEEDTSAVIDDTKGTVTIMIDYQVDDLTFLPTITLTEGATISPNDPQALDASKKNSYTVRTTDKEKSYDVIFLIDEELSFDSLSVNGTKCWFNEIDGKIYVPVDRSLWNIGARITAEGTGIRKIYIDGAPVEATKESVVLDFTKEQQLTLEKNAEEKINFTIVASGLPIVHLEGKWSDISGLPGRDQEKAGIDISVYDPTNGGKYTIEKAYAGIKRRGGYSSSMYDKRPYSLEFRDRETNEEVNLRLFGLRKDGDWILDAMATDNIRMRNRVATDIWNDLYKLKYNEEGAVPATRGQMVEVYYNGSYHGLYCMTERIDRKQLQLNADNGYLWKAEGWDRAIQLTGYYGGYYLPNTGDERWSDTEEGYQAEYPKPVYQWTPLVDFVKFVVDSNDTKLVSDIDSWFDVDNLVDFFILNNIMGATDNASKNSFVALYNEAGSAEDKKLFYSVWDMDGTFGIDWALQRKTPGKGIVCFQNSYYCDGENRLIGRLAKNSTGFGTRVKKRWGEVKGGVCSQENIVQRFRDYEELMVKSGAYARELKKWKNDSAKELGPEIDYIDGWLGTHLTYFNSYIQDWDSNVSKLRF